MTVAQLEQKDCTGCKMCKEVCPVDAISFTVNQTGFWYPKVNEQICIRCGNCEKVCKEQVYGSGAPLIAYQAWLKDKELRRKSTSGGAYYAAAKAILEEGGVLAGCVYEKDFKGAKYEIAENMDGLFQIMGNKYFQSDMQGIYSKIKSITTRGERNVLFCGTPCQCAAVRRYLGKEQKQVFLIELICSGINSPKAFSAFLEELESAYGAPVSKVHQRNKKTGWMNLGTYVAFANGKEYYRDIHNDPWMNGFAADKLYIRPACFGCRYKERKRMGDITIGDFWGIQNAAKQDEFLGISAITINTQKGRILFEKMKDLLVYRRCSVHSVTKGNSAYFQDVEKRYRTEEFFNRLEEDSFSNIVSAMTGKNVGV